MPGHGLLAATILAVPLCLPALLAPGPAAAQPPWVITGPVTVTAPMDVGDVTIAQGGSLTVEGVPEPGFRIAGNLQVLDGTATFRDSVIQVLSAYHGQYGAITGGTSRLVVERCAYRVPSGVQHGLIAAGDSRIELRDTDFPSVQLVPVERGTIVAERVNGMFECVVLDAARLELTAVPRDPGGGAAWVWPTFPAGSVCTYSPPLPGAVAAYDFPPPACTGIAQSFSLRDTQVMLWPLLVRAGAKLTLKDVAPENWMVVGLFLPSDAKIAKLRNGRTREDWTLPLTDRTVRLRRATVDTWNLYATGQAKVEVADSHLGEILADGTSRVRVARTTVDGSGGYFGARGASVVKVEDSRITCDVLAANTARLTLRRSTVLPYPHDPTGAWTRFAAFDDAVIHVDDTGVATTPALGGRGAFAVTWLADAPARPPRSTPAVLHGTAALFSLDPAAALQAWRLTAVEAATGRKKPLGEGAANVDAGELGTWSGADRDGRYALKLRLTDGRGRTFTGTTAVPSPAAGP